MRFGVLRVCSWILCNLLTMLIAMGRVGRFGLSLPLPFQILFHGQVLPLHQAMSEILSVARDVGVFVFDQRVEFTAKLIHGAQCAVDEPVDLGVLPVGFAQVGGDLLEPTAALIKALADANVVVVG